MADGDAWFWVLTLGVAVVGGGMASLRSLQIARLIEDTPTSRVRSAAQGYVELMGRATPLDNVRNLAPLTQRPCVWWRYRIQRKSEGGGKRQDSWQTVASGRSAQPFLLDDGTGRCIVQPESAEVVTNESTTWYGDTPWPAGAPAQGGRPRASGGREYRYFEERIYEHELVCALGDFRSHASVGVRDLQAETSALLAEWKQDQAALVQRFDKDGDGRISLEEWERAREEAKRAVIDRDLDQPSVETLHVLGRPGGGQLFLIAALPEGDVARRYRRRALLAFCGFVAAVCGLGWILQNALH